jgi:hypothetical protein
MGSFSRSARIPAFRQAKQRRAALEASIEELA